MPTPRCLSIRGNESFLRMEGWREDDDGDRGGGRGGCGKSEGKNGRTIRLHCDPAERRMVAMTTEAKSHVTQRS